MAASTGSLRRRLEKENTTQLYNETPAWLKDAHGELDNAVLGAYGWSGSLGDRKYSPDFSG